MARIAAAFFASIALLAAYTIAGIGKRKPEDLYTHAIHWSRRWGRTMCRIGGVRVTVVGAPPPPGSLIASNHISYTDIPSLLSATGCFFLPKAELGDWPVIGSFIRFARQPLVKRVKSRGMKATAAEVEDRLRRAKSVCVFLEGTTTGGDRILQFQPSFLQPAIDAGAPVVPTAIVYHSPDPAINVREDYGYWRGVHAFMPHLWRSMGLSGLEAEIRFGEPISAAGRDRKSLAIEARREAMRLAGLTVDLIAAPPDAPAQAGAEAERSIELV